MAPSPSCGLCGRPTDPVLLAEATRYAFWTRPDGACPACVQATLLTTLLERGEELFHDAVQRAWPLDAEAAFGALPTPLRLHADPRFTGRGVTIAIADSGFAAHPDLIRPTNRVRVWVDASRTPTTARRFGPDESPVWPGSTAANDHQWHGTMTSVVVAGNGFSSHGLYRSLAPDAELVLLHLTDPDGRITDQSILRALTWIEEQAERYGIRVVSLSVAGDEPADAMLGPIERAVERLVASGITVLAAAGNDGERHLVPPATAPSVITVGGLDDRNTLDHQSWQLWHSNFGDSATGTPKPELVAPSLWVVAPVLPGSAVAREATTLFALRGAPDQEARISELKLVTPDYQHVDGTSFAAPIAAATVAAMLEANPHLTPRLVRELLIRSAHPVPGAPPERQGAGALDAGRAVALAVLERHGWDGPSPITPLVTAAGAVFRVHDDAAGQVAVFGSWDDWQQATPCHLHEPGLWSAAPIPLRPGEYQYKLKIDDRLWLTDPTNPWRSPDGLGGINSRFRWLA